MLLRRIAVASLLRARLTSWMALPVACFTLCLCVPATAQSSNGVLREVYANIAGGAVADLTSHPSFPNSPSLETIQPTFEAPSEFSENYGQRMRALLVAPATGSYTFWIATDDGGALYLSTTAEPAQKVQIATVNGWTSSREWTKEPNQRSVLIPLTAGQQYYIEALQKEGGGGDNLAVRWQLPNGTIEEPIPQNRLIIYGLGPPVITQNPTNVTVVEGGSAGFEVRLARMIGATFQWRRNGTNIPGAIFPSYSLGPLTLADSTNKFRCAIANAYGTTNSAEVTLTVLPDTTRPIVSTVGNLGEETVLFIAFSEPVEVASATNTASYVINNGVSVLRATLGLDGRTVILTTTSMPVGVTNTIAISNVRDRASTPNTMLAIQRTFLIATRPIDASYVTLPPEPLGPSSRRHGVVISEVMYHPTNRFDGKNLEFIELYNSQLWFEDLSGWRISGAVDYTFPSNTTLASKAFAIVAANATDFRSVYTTLPSVFGPFAGSNGLQNSSGTLRLRNKVGAVVFEMNYQGDAPFPPQADGAGHSLVLARASYGERDPRAWGTSTAIGGTPGSQDALSSSTFRSLVINEFLAHTDPPDVDYIELYNYANVPLGVGGVILTDDPDTNKFLIPAGTTIPANGFLVYTEAQLGFALSSGGETIYLKHSSGRTVIDAVRFEAQENGVATGRYPDGARSFTRLAVPTPGGANAAFRPKSVVINEIMFDPISNDAEDEYVELHNRTGNPVDLSGWRLRDGISFNLPDGTVLPGNGYLVIAHNAARLRSLHSHLTAANCLGDYSGSLANRGELIELNKPDEVVSTNAFGQLRTNVIHVPVDEVTYGSGGRWGRWAGGGGSSLELRDARSDGRLAPNWGDSDESAKSPWVTVEATGVMDHGWADAYQLHITLLGAGEALVDNVELIPAGSTNVIGNGTFEGGAAGWVFQGNHNDTSWEPTAGFSSAASLHLRATGRGDTGANRVRTQLPATLAAGTTVTLRARVRWLKGCPNILLRVRGNWMEAPGYILAANQLGTPGQPNTTAANAGPAISDVRHFPALPAANDPVLIVAKVQDPDGLAYLVVNYRIDPDTNFTTVAMTNNGAGLFSTVLPGRVAGVTAAFHVQAIDNFSTPAGSVFPAEAPGRECVIRWGDNTIPGSLGTYRFWLTLTNVTRWSVEEKMSNKAKDVTFIHGTNRVIYNAGAWFHGSPYHSPGYNSPVGVSCDYDMLFPDDDRFLGESDINLFRPGNGGGDGTGQAEIQGYWFGGEFGLPFLYHRPVFVFVNGQRRDTIFHDAQQPNGDFVEQWYPDDPEGDLHKIMLGFEFGDQATGANEGGYAAVGANLSSYTTTGGVFKQARYRQTWPRRAAAAQELNDYTNIFNLVNVALTNAALGSEAYTAALDAAVDVEEWFKVHVVQHLYNNPDSFSYGGGQNAFAYKPERDTWKLLLWDIDFAFGGSATDPNLFGIGGADHGPRNDHPPFTRIYWQALIEAAQGMLTPARANAILDARYNGMTAAGAGVGSPQGIKDFIAARRSFILSQVALNQSPFAITSNGGADFSTNRNLITLTGTAPLDVRQLLVNGRAYPITWTSVSTWVLRIPLVSGTNVLSLTGLDPRGAAVSGVTGTVRVTYTGADEQPEDRIVINEVMYHPAKPDASYVELLNTSAANAFDLSGWRLDGVDFDFPRGTVLEPGAFLLVVENVAGFIDAYGPSTTIAGVFAGRLDNGGETLTLLRPGAAPGSVEIVDQFTYDDDPPWSPAADGFGPSLQLIDASRDNNRVANWAVAAAALTNPPQSILPITHTWRYSTNDAFNDGAWTAPAYNDAAWLTGGALLYFEEAVLPAPKTTQVARGRTTYYFRTRFNFNGSLSGAALQFSTLLDDGAVFYLNGQEFYRLRVPAGPVNYATFAAPGVGDAVAYDGPFIVPAAALVQGQNVLAVEVHQQNATSSDVVFGMTLEVVYSTVAPFTPGVANSVRSSLPAFPMVWLNEVLPNNLPVGTSGIADRFGDRDPWVEIFNGGTNAVNLGGYALANNYTNLGQWLFPANTILSPGQFRFVWLDGEPGESDATELHAGFRAAANVGSIVLSRGTNATDIVDYLNYNVPVGSHSYGSHPDGAVSRRRTFALVTPGASNNPARPPIDVRINEWMADNTANLADPADGNFEDWFELFNPGQEPVDLTGCQLTDTLANPALWTVPDGTIIPAGGRLLVWADGETTQNSSSRIDLHAGFSLGRNGESIALFASDGTLVDLITFGPQLADISEGRYPDGQAELEFFGTPTPRLPNYISAANTPPSLAPVLPRTVDEGALLTFPLEASDGDQPLQALTYAMTGGSAGASLNATNGVFRWVPAENEGPGIYSFDFVVRDDGIPSLAATQAVTITVREVNNPPQLIPANSASVPEGGTLSLTNAASDPDSDLQTLAFSLEPGFPTGITLDAVTGVLTWTPTEAQGPGTYTIGLQVTDSGVPPLSAAASVTISVTELNTPPQIAPVADQTVEVGTLMRLDLDATDSDLPLQTMTFSLVPPVPAGAGIDLSTGWFEWSPAATDVGTNQLVVRVSDDGLPSLAGTQTFQIVVLEPLQLSIHRTDSALVITFSTRPGRTYRLESSVELNSAEWIAVGSEVTANESTFSVQLRLPSEPQAFYRVRPVD